MDGIRLCTRKSLFPFGQCIFQFAPWLIFSPQPLTDGVFFAVHVPEVQRLENCVHIGRASQTADQKGSEIWNADLPSHHDCMG